MEKVYKSKVAKWYLWFCIGMTIAFIGSIYLCYQSTWVLLIDVVFMGIALFMIYSCITALSFNFGAIMLPLLFKSLHCVIM